MTVSASAQQPTMWRRRTGYWWVVLSSVAIVAFAVMPYVMSSLPELARADVGLARNYEHRSPFVQVALYVHVFCAGLALLLSPAQFAARLRTRVPRLHRTLGRVVLGAIVVGGCAGVVISTVSLAGPVGTIGFGALGVLWVGFAVTAYRAIRRGDVRAHRRWMVRAFSLTYAGVMLRLWMPLLVVLQVTVQGVGPQTAFDRAYQLIPFLCWVPNLLVAEWFLSKDRASTPSSTRREPEPDHAE